jgi:hypothetical protein
LEFGTDDYKAHVSTVRFEPETSTIRWRGLSPTARFSAQTAADWTCVLNVAQDWTTTNSLARYLLENEGEEVDVVFRPQAGGPSFAATLLLAAPAIGGDVDTVPASSVTCGVIGKPVYAPAA